MNLECRRKDITFFPTKLRLTGVQADLQLSAKQRATLLEARQTLLRKMEDICQRRRDILSQLGLEMLSTPEVRMVPGLSAAASRIVHFGNLSFGFLAAQHTGKQPQVRGLGNVEILDAFFY